MPAPVWRRIIADYLQRAQSPLAPADWETVDAAVNRTARGIRVARRFLSIWPVPGPGMRPVGDLPPDPAWPRRPEAEAQAPLELPIIHHDFEVPAVPPGQVPRLALDGAVQAATVCALAEDHLVFNGHGGLGYPGLLTAAGRQRLERSDWRRPGAVRRDVAAAAALLLGAGCPGPYALVVPAALHALLDPGALTRVCRAGVFASTALAGQAAALVAPARRHLDLAVAQDLITAYLGARDGVGLYRVFGLLIHRIKRPEAICTLEG